jgi:small subunit ribosomal protein S16
MGRKKQPHYRVVVADSLSPRDGRFVETLGYYKPLSQPARLVLDLERIDYWLGQGAEPSGTMKSLITKARKGGDAKVAVGEEDQEEAKLKRAEALAAKRAAEKKAVEEAAEAAKAAEETAAAEAAAAAAAEEAATTAEAEAAEPEAEAAAEEAPEAEAAVEEAPDAEPADEAKAEEEKAE